MYVIVVTCTNHAFVDIDDISHHIMYVSISRVHEYHVYIVGQVPAPFQDIAALYIPRQNTTYLRDYTEILENPDIQDVLALEYFDIIQDPTTLAATNHWIAKDMLGNLHIYTPVLNLLDYCDYVDAIVRSESPAMAMLCAHSNYLDHSYDDVLGNIRNVGISCVMVVHNVDPMSLAQAFECFETQTHTHAELVVVVNSSSEYVIPPAYTKIVCDASVQAMRNAGIAACTKHYVCRWNVMSWYHKSFLSVLAQKSESASVDYISVNQIVSIAHAAFYISYPRNTGWEGVLMVAQDKISEYSETPHADTIHMMTCLERCPNRLILDRSTTILHVDKQRVASPMDTPIPKKLAVYYAHTIFALPKLEIQIAPKVVIAAPTPPQTQTQASKLGLIDYILTMFRKSE